MKGLGLRRRTDFGRGRRGCGPLHVRTWSRAYGVGDLEAGQPATADDRVSVASVTKSMTAVAVLKLVDDGLIGLDDPVNGVLDSFATVLRPPGPITVRQLLAHTSGMPSFQEANEKSIEDVARAVSEEMSTQRGLELTAALPWEAQDVGSFRYSDSNYLALGQLLEKLRGKAFAQVLRDDVINQLGLGATSIDQAVRGEPDMIHGYITLRGERLDVTQPPADLGSPAFGAISTMHDVNDFFGSTDGQQQASMTLVTPPIPTPLEDPGSVDKFALWDGQMASALQETLDRLC